MNISNRSATFIFILFTFLLNSCASSEETVYTPPTLLGFSETGLLGQPISIQIENFELNKLQVFFDEEEATVNYVSDKEISVVVPRSIKTSHPILKIIDLNENKIILNKTLYLKKPSISKYSSGDITFNETLTIYGENFDIQKDFVAVYVNNEMATIINTDYNKIEIQIPQKIIKADLDIKVKSQLQEISSSIPLVLKNPIIKGVVQSSGIWLQQSLNVDVENFNPNAEFGEVLIDGLPCFFTVYNNKLEVVIPPGPYKDFKINNITYKTAGLTSSYDCKINILNDFILVDHIDKANIQHNIFVHNNKAYLFKYIVEGNDNFERKYSLLEFSPITEKWTELSSFHYNGYITEAVYDNDDTVYLYKMSVANQSFTLSKLNINTFKDTAIDLPSNKIFSPILFAYQDNLYLLSGLNISDTGVTVRDQKFKYSKATNSWTDLPISAFSGLPLTDRDSGGGNACRYLFNNGNIYISYGINFKTFKISPNLTVTTYPYEFYFDYSNSIIGRYNNFFDYLYNITTKASKPIDIYSLTGYSENFFTLNNEIYYLRNSWSLYYQNTIYTQKLKKEVLNGLL